MTTITKGAPRPEPAGIHRRGFLRMMSASGAALAGAGAAGMVASAAEATPSPDDDELLSLGRAFDRLVLAYEDAGLRNDAAYEPILVKHGGTDAIRRRSLEELQSWRDDLNACQIYKSTGFEMDALYKELEACSDKIRELKARTIDALAVKGKALRRELLLDHPGDEPADAWDWSGQIALELIDNIERVAQMMRSS